MGKMRIGKGLVSLVVALTLSVGLISSSWAGPGTSGPCTVGKATVTSNDGSCLDSTPAQGGGPDNWEVVEGGSYTMTISSANCPPGTEGITVFIQSSESGN